MTARIRPYPLGEVVQRYENWLALPGIGNILFSRPKRGRLLKDGFCSTDRRFVPWTTNSYGRHLVMNGRMQVQREFLRRVVTGGVVQQNSGFFTVCHEGQVTNMWKG